MSEQTARDLRPWERQWKEESLWSAKELAKLCCGWNPDTGWDPDCGWEHGDPDSDHAVIAEVSYKQALAKIRRAWRLGDLQAIDLQIPATEVELSSDDVVVFRSREAAAWAAKRFPDFPYKEDDWLDAPAAMTAPADAQSRVTSDLVAPTTAVPEPLTRAVDAATTLAEHATVVEGSAVSVAEIKAPGVAVLSVASVVGASDTNIAEPTNERARVEAFIQRVRKETSRKINRTDIWRVAGYTEPTEFERFQRGKRATAGSTSKFVRLLQLTPKEFVDRLDRLPSIPAK